MTVGQLLQGFASRFLVTHHLINAHFRKRKFLIGSFSLLNTFQNRKHLAVIILLIVQLSQDAEHIRALMIVFIQTLVGSNGLVESARSDVILRHPLLVMTVFRLQGSRLFELFQRQRIFLLLGQQASLNIISFGSLWMEGQALVQQTVRQLQLAGIQLTNSLKKEIVVL